jgi:hypothetical protein
MVAQVIAYVPIRRCCRTVMAGLLDYVGVLSESLLIRPAAHGVTRPENLPSADNLPPNVEPCNVLTPLYSSTSGWDGL